jgi:predicted double-glycine peptidase
MAAVPEEDRLAQGRSSPARSGSSCAGAVFTMGRALLLAMSVALSSPAPAGAREARPVRSMLELRRDRVVQQGFDLSCGAAALSTILTYELGDRVTEGEVVAGLLGKADPERIRKQGGFTLLDLKRYAKARGHHAAGYGDLSLAALGTLGTAIVPTTMNGQPHFMIFRGIAGNRVVLADPAYGNRTMSAERFEALWSPRVAFVVRRPREAATGVPPEASAALVPDAVLRSAGRWTR